MTQVIDEYKQKELAWQQELVQAADEARRANIAKSDFLSRMSHDIRTPINGIMGLLDIEELNRTARKDFGSATPGYVYVPPICWD